MQVTIQDVLQYSVNGEMAYEIVYSEGTKSRAVESAGNIIRTEAFIKGAWKATCKPYVVNHNKKRNAEVIKATVIKLLKGV